MAARIIIKQREVNKLLKDPGVYLKVDEVGHGIDSRASASSLTRYDIQVGPDRVRAAVIAGYNTFGDQAAEHTRTTLLGSI